MTNSSEKGLEVLILAAGLGTRMRSNLAKVLHALDGRELINHVCKTARSLEPKKIYAVIGHQGDRVREAVLRETSDDLAEFVTQKQQLGTGDAVNAAREFLKESAGDLVILSGDVPLIKKETLEALIRTHKDSNAAATILTVILDDPTGYGRIIRESDESFSKIVEQKDATDEERRSREINSGIYCFNTKLLFDALEKVTPSVVTGEYYLTDVPALLKAAGKTVALFVHTDNYEIEGINNREQLAKMEKFVRDTTISRLMLDDGVTFIDPANAYVSAAAKIGKDTVIYPGVSIEGETVIGENCVVRAGTRIANATIADGTEILDNCVIVDSEVGVGCTVGPFAHLRGHARMEEKAKVGNFVELKKTVLGKGSKANHLTYLGDATIGEKTNIGAGTITCNYDGKNKHATKIGNGVKIGSDTMLIAPVEVGDGAVTGAGSVVTKDIAPNKLAVGAPARAIRTLE